MQKNRVLFVAHHLTIGGVQKSLVSALNAIDYDKNDVTLYLRKNRLVLLPYINENAHVLINKDKHHYYRKPYSVWLQVKAKILDLFGKDSSIVIRALGDYIRNKQFEFEKKSYFSYSIFDIAIAYNEGYTAEFVVDCVKAKRKIMFFQSSTDLYPEVHQRILSMFDEIVVEHRDIKDSLSSWYPEDIDKVTVVENYTDYHMLQKMSKEQEVEVFSDRVTLCTCSRFSPEKGIDLAIEAAGIMKSRGHSFLWYILGDGLEMEKIKSLIERYDLSDCVRLMGMQTNPYPYMAACDVFVQPSREEALSIAMLESQILCAPMVSTKTAGGLAMIKEGVNGLLSDINPESLADRIEELMVNKELRTRIKQHLSSIDYSEEEERYKRDWKKLLS